MSKTSEIISISPSAAKQLIRIRNANDINKSFGLRVGAKAGGGCSGGFTYILGFDQFKEGDKIYEIDGFTVYINIAQSLYLFGMKIDWYEDENTKGFTFTNPNAKTSEDNYFTI